MAEVAPFHVMELLARAKELEAAGRTIVHMEIGEPDFPTARPICDAGIRAIESGKHFYTPALGIPALRAAIARFYRERYGVEVPASRIVVTSGASGALLLAIGVLIDPGDEVLMADPGYPCNRNFVRMMGGVPAEVPVGAESAYQLLPEMVARHWTPRTKAVMVASPSNPTGTLMPEESLRAIARTVRERGGALIVDEIYHGLVYDGEYTTALKHGDDLFVINSFSKYFNMTGWRLGWLVVPPAYVREFDKLSQNMYLSAPSVAQHAALAAFEPASARNPRSAPRGIQGAARLPGARAARARLSYSGGAARGVLYLRRLQRADRRQFCVRARLTRNRGGRDHARR